MKTAHAVSAILVTATLALCVSPAGPDASGGNSAHPPFKTGAATIDADTAGHADTGSPLDEPSHRVSIDPPGESCIDVKIFRFLNRSLANPVLDAVMPIITELKRWRIVLLVVWSLLVLIGGTRGRWAALMLIPLVAASDQISSHVLKPLIQRVRPCEVLGNVHLWYGPEGWLTTPARVARSYKASFSFPSSHAANITASMLFLGLVYRRLIAPLLVIAVAVSYSRIYIGVHWPLDAVAGMALGGLLAWPAYVMFRRLSAGKIERTASRTKTAHSEPDTKTTRSEPDTPPSE
jgi:undecaprenyl-diphosphatase